MIRGKAAKQQGGEYLRTVTKDTLAQASGRVVG